MTRKHFEAIAQMFGDILAGTDDPRRRSGVETVVNRFVYKLLPSFNPGFDAARFRARITAVESELRKPLS